MTAPSKHDPLNPLETYRRMALVRRFEERCLELAGEGLIAGSIHLCAGQEAVAVGVAEALGADDRTVATYRGHGWALACGVPPVQVLAEICHREGGVNGGRGGSAHFSAIEHGFLGENSIVGAGVPIACGAALASQVRDEGRVVVVSIGDGATNQGAVHEALAFAAARNLPVVIVVEHNGWSEMTPTASMVRVTNLAERAAGYGIPGRTIDGGDPAAVRAAVEAAAEEARSGTGPVLLEAKTVRLLGHYNRDIEHYRSQEDRDQAAAADPVERLRAQLEADGVERDAIDAADAAARAEVDAATAAVREMAQPDPATARDHLYAAAAPLPAPLPDPGEPRGEQLSYVKAVTSALHTELADRPEVVVYGEDVGGAGGIFGATRGLQAEFGAERVFDTPIAESAILGSAVGAAIEGLRPVVEIMWADFMLVAFDQLVNQAANVRYVSRGAQQAPMVVRTQQGATPGSCAQHSQSLEALLAHVPGLRVGLPATPQDAYAMLRAAVADDDPCVLIEARSLYQLRGAVDVGAPVEPIGGARVRRAGADATIITWGAIQHVAMAAAEQLAAEGIEIGVVDLRWLSPLDDAALDYAVAAGNGRVMVVHEANLTGGFGAEIAAGIQEHRFDELDAPVVRVAALDSRIPAAPALQDEILPGVERIAAAARQLVVAGTSTRSRSSSTAAR